MALILRPPKTGGTSRYTSEVQNGFDLIRETEVDGDLDTIYSEFNGGIDDENIRPGASIDYSKLDLHGRIEPGDLDPNPTAPLPPNWIPSGSVPGASIAPDSIGPSQLAPNACLPTFSQASNWGPDTPQSGSTPVNDYLSATITPLTGVIRVAGMVQGTAATTPTVDTVIHVRCRVGATTILEISRFMRADGNTPWTVPFTFWNFVTANVAVTVHIDVFQPGPNYTLNTIAAGSLVVEAWNQ
jgi:hypothetical protein